VFRRKAEKTIGKDGGAGELRTRSRRLGSKGEGRTGKNACATKGEEKRANLSERPGPQKPRKIGHYAGKASAKDGKRKRAGGTPFPGQAGVTKKARRKKSRSERAGEQRVRDDTT